MTTADQGQDGAGQKAEPVVGPGPGLSSVPVPEPLRPHPYRIQDRIVIGLLVGVIAAAAVYMLWYVRENANVLVPHSLKPAALAIGLMKKPPELRVAAPVGSVDARVKVAVVMEHCLEPVQDLLVRLGTAFPGQVRAEFVSMYSPEGQRVLYEHGESCAGVFVNGKNRVRLAAGGAEKEFILHGMPGGGYNLSHVAAAVRQELVAAYGSVPVEFDQVAAVKDLPAPATPSEGGAQGAIGPGSPGH
jgi:hypothetical protein